MPIEVGMRIPEVDLLLRSEDAQNLKVPLGEKLRGRKVVLIGMPGAFTGTCTGSHVPSLVRTAPALAAKGVDEIIIFVVNDPQVTRIWAEQTGATAAGITVLADAGSALTQALDMAYDAPAAGLYRRCTRFSSVVEDGVVTRVFVEQSFGVCDLTAGETILESL